MNYCKYILANDGNCVSQMYICIGSQYFAQSTALYIYLVLIPFFSSHLYTLLMTGQ
jgi:hypothetical protein